MLARPNRRLHEPAGFNWVSRSGAVEDKGLARENTADNYATEVECRERVRSTHIER